MLEVDTSQRTDRELLLILYERVGTVLADIKSLKDSTARELSTLMVKVDLLEKHKADKAEINLQLSKITNDSESRSKQIDRLTNYVWFGFGAVAVLQAAIAFWLKYH